MSKVKYKTSWTPNKGGIQLSQSELEKSYRTLIGKPVMFESDKTVGIITDAELIDDVIEIEFDSLQLRAMGHHKGILPITGFYFIAMYLSSTQNTIGDNDE